MLLCKRGCLNALLTTPHVPHRPTDEQREYINNLKKERKAKSKAEHAHRPSNFIARVRESRSGSKPSKAPGDLDGHLEGHSTSTVDVSTRANGGGGGGGAGEDVTHETTADGYKRPILLKSAEGSGAGMGGLLGARSAPSRSDSSSGPPSAAIEAKVAVREAFSRPLHDTLEEVKREREAAAAAAKSKGRKSAEKRRSTAETDGGGGEDTPTATKMKQLSRLMLGKRSNTDSTTTSDTTRTLPPRASSPQASPTEIGAEGEDGSPATPSNKQQQQRPGLLARTSTAMHRVSTPHTPASIHWSALRRRLSQARQAKQQQQQKMTVGGPDLMQELQSGILPVLMLKMSVERDEQKNRRIPVLLNHLKLKITDSVNPISSHAVFRIELEYGDGLIKWVCYRELRDFYKLHTHYRAAALRGFIGRPVGSPDSDLGLPSFPRASFPYLAQLQRQSKSKRARFAKLQREALEKYLIELIRALMWRPEANRLCKFFEISALSVSLASRGGFQGKQGYLRILSRSSRKAEQRSALMGPLRWFESHNPKWFIVRESFIAMVDEPDSLQVYDVFLLDNEFEIIQPKRIYRKTLALGSVAKDKIKSKGDGDDGDAADAEKEHEDVTAMLTNGHFRDEKDQKAQGSKGTATASGVSSHTFYIKNSERKLKLVAKTERLMNQFIASLESVAARNVFTGSNRFGSFAPIRLNCNAQWLVDGRDYFWNLSKALLMAKDRVFIHDWWLSPELYLRRPGQLKYRLDHILKKKAEEGVKIFVIVYNEVSNNFTPTDSNYTKQRLIGLHRNIYVQRSPSHFQTGTFYWAHHEKLCVIDETIAFMGGLDLCECRVRAGVRTRLFAYLS